MSNLDVTPFLEHFIAKCADRGQETPERVYFYLFIYLFIYLFFIYLFIYFILFFLWGGEAGTGKYKLVMKMILNAVSKLKCISQRRVGFVSRNRNDVLALLI